MILTIAIVCLLYYFDDVPRLNENLVQSVETMSDKVKIRYL
jgi:hypothetical protein